MVYTPDAARVSVGDTCKSLAPTPPVQRHLDRERSLGRVLLPPERSHRHRDYRHDHRTVTCTQYDGGRVHRPVLDALHPPLPDDGDRATPASLDPFQQLNTAWTFTETIGDDITFYQLAAARLWNGEMHPRQPTGGLRHGLRDRRRRRRTSRVDGAGRGLRAASRGSTSRRSPSPAGPSGDSGDGCRGFRSKSDLSPATSSRPRPPTQITQIGPYIDGELPIAATGDPATYGRDARRHYAGRSVRLRRRVPDYVDGLLGGTGAPVDRARAPRRRATRRSPTR